MISQQMKVEADVRIQLSFIKEAIWKDMHKFKQTLFSPHYFFMLENIIIDYKKSYSCKELIILIFK